MAKSRNWFTLIIGLCLLAMLVTAACGPASPAIEPQPQQHKQAQQTPFNLPRWNIKISGAIPLTGTSSAGGVDLFFGYTGQSNINAAGGFIIGQRLSVIFNC
jgi:hypothetical protein